MPRKVILTCAVSGAAVADHKHPNFPHTPEEISAAVIEAARAGASVAHIHARDPQTRSGSRKVAYFEEIVDRIRQSGVDIVINLTCGDGGELFPDPNNEAVALPESDIAGAEERVAHLVACCPEIASLDVTTGNQVFDGRDGVYLNTTHTLRKMAKLFQELDVKPEIEVFGAGDILFAKQLISEGLVDGVPMIQMVLGVNWASPSDAETVQYLKGYFDPGTCWGVLGIGREQMRMVAQSVLLGGNARVGLEDNLYLDKGVFATNGQLVERAITIIRAIGEDVATPAETRQLLGLKNGP